MALAVVAPVESTAEAGYPELRVLAQLAKVSPVVTEIMMLQAQEIREVAAVAPVARDLNLSLLRAVTVAPVTRQPFLVQQRTMPRAAEAHPIIHIRRVSEGPAAAAMAGLETVLIRVM